MTMKEVRYAFGDPFTTHKAWLCDSEILLDIWIYKPPVISLAARTDYIDQSIYCAFINKVLIKWGDAKVDLFYKSLKKKPLELGRG